MKPARAFFVGLALCFPAEAGVAQQPARSIAELQRQLSEHLSQPKFVGAMWGVKVVSLDSGEIIFEHNPQKLFSPASNSKLYTMAMALDRLGPDYRIETSLYVTSRPNRSGTLKGDLMVYGRGDPTINARLHETNVYSALEPFVAALTRAGMKRIAGDLIADESFFRGPPYGSGWAWDDMEYYYGAEVSALTINDNTLQLTLKPGQVIGDPCELALLPPLPATPILRHPTFAEKGGEHNLRFQRPAREVRFVPAYLAFSNRTRTVVSGARRRINLYRPIEQNVVYLSGEMAADDGGYVEDVTVHNPAGLFAVFLREALARRGITVRGNIRTVNWLDREKTPMNWNELIELGSVESLPIRDIIREVQKPSQNLYTDLILAHVGERTRRSDTPSSRTSEDLGIDELNRFAREVGINSGDLQFEEGSGLSRNNLTTPNATIALLQFMSRHKSADVYLDALPIAGVDGTLRNRMKGTPAAGNARAKTGTLRWANSLSGQVKTASGERLIFSIMLNRYYNTDPNRTARAEVDTIAVMLASFNGSTRR
jgi:D-alanyl-D-alanine carboxypeptidase/D-alanyl-D-alanine-endopeptidase (penicillin-binding protein 4)